MNWSLHGLTLTVNDPLRSAAKRNDPSRAAEAPAPAPKAFEVRSLLEMDRNGDVIAPGSLRELDRSLDGAGAMEMEHDVFLTERDLDRVVCPGVRTVGRGPERTGIAGPAYLEPSRVVGFRLKVPPPHPIPAHARAGEPSSLEQERCACDRFPIVVQDCA